MRSGVAANQQRKQKGRDLFGPAPVARFQGLEIEPAISDERTVKSLSNLGFGFSSFA